MKIRLLSALIAAAATPFASPTHAETARGPMLAIEHIDYQYRQHGDGERHRGNLFGLVGAYTWTFDRHLFLRTTLATAAGRVTQTHPEAGRIECVRQRIGDVRIEVGRDFSVGERATLALSTGLGGRGQSDLGHGRVSDRGAPGIDREIDHVYLPLSAVLTLPAGERARWRLHGEYTHVLSGEIEAKLSRLDAGLPDVTLSSRRGHGYDVGVALQLPLGARHRLAVGPYARGSSLRRSGEVEVADPDAAGETFTVFEPSSRTREIGVRAMVSF